MNSKDHNIPTMKTTGLLLFLTLVLMGCRQSVVLTSQHEIDVKVPRAAAIVPKDSTFYFQAGLAEPSIVFRYYRSRQFLQAWMGNGTGRSLADSMTSVIRSIRYYGLQPQQYHLSQIDLINSDTLKSDSIGMVDILLTDSFFSLANDLKFGRMQKAILPVSNDSSCIALLDQMFHKGSLKILFSREPNIFAYHQLKAGLRQMLDSISPAQRQLLLSGLTVDSVDLQQSIQCIEINLERWRNEKPLPNNYIWINIPAFQLYVVDNDSVVFNSKVIVGTSKRQTPILTSSIECFVIYPYWHVPRRIAVEELLPMIQRDSNYLKLANFDVLDRKGNVVDTKTLPWSDYSINYFPFSLRQREGSENSLGVIKFLFDNPYSVYLHDTNSKRLFSNQRRALSHGCIRIEKAVQLAHYLIRSTPGGGESIDNYLRLKQKHVTSLSVPIPIYTRYFTCDYVDGRLQFYNDVYNKDVNLIKAFYQPSRISL